MEVVICGRAPDVGVDGWGVGDIVVLAGEEENGRDGLAWGDLGDDFLGDGTEVVPAVYADGGGEKAAAIPAELFVSPLLPPVENALDFVTKCRTFVRRAIGFVEEAEKACAIMELKDVVRL